MFLENKECQDVSCRFDFFKLFHSNVYRNLDKRDHTYYHESDQFAEVKYFSVSSTQQTIPVFDTHNSRDHELI